MRERGAMVITVTRRERRHGRRRDDVLVKDIEDVDEDDNATETDGMRTRRSMQSSHHG
jgi:hypothetical protein